MPGPGKTGPGMNWSALYPDHVVFWIVRPVSLTIPAVFPPYPGAGPPATVLHPIKRPGVAEGTPVLHPVMMTGGIHQKTRVQYTERNLAAVRLSMAGEGCCTDY